MEQQWTINNDGWLDVEKVLQEAWDKSVITGWDDIPVWDRLDLSGWDVDLTAW